jgi:phenylalanyl-tRNA synthetase beta chain
MVISYKWLNELLDFNLSPQDLGEVLTSVGLETESVEKWESVKGGLAGVLIGQVLEVKPHPNADKLRLTLVNIGTPDPLAIVCGAPNVAERQKVLVALVGATIYPVSGEPLTLKKAKIRGEESNGMICAADELGMGTDHSGVWVLPEDAPVGMPAAEYFKLSSDDIISIGLTPNRSDAFSHLGVARDLYAVLKTGYSKNVSLKIPATDDLHPGIKCSVNPQITEPALSMRYALVEIGSLKVGPSPKWLKDRLESLGMRSVNNVVDVTNYVMLETGQPLHAFDRSAISGHKIMVTRSTAGTKFVALDGKAYELNGEEIVIADENGPLCLAGVFGGKDSGVTETTGSIVLESAAFDAVLVRRTSFRHGLRTESAQRFEKGTDPAQIPFALKRAVYLLKQIAAADQVSEIAEQISGNWEHHPVELSVSRVRKVLGAPISDAEIAEILELLGFRIPERNSDLWLVIPPAAKTDVSRFADVVEEIARIYGYNRIPFPGKFSFSMQPSKPASTSDAPVLASLLCGMGFREALCNSVGKSSWYGENSPKDLVRLLNSQTSELDIMRRDMLMPLLEVLTHNLNHRNSPLALFETGRVYYKKEEGGYEEEEHLALITAGQQAAASWLGPAEKAGFFRLKPVLEDILKRNCGQWDELKPLAEGPYRFGSVYLLRQVPIAWVGEIDPALLRQFGIEEVVAYADLRLDLIRQMKEGLKPVYKETGRFPQVRRDLSVLVKGEIPFADISRMARKESKGLLRETSLLDVYQGKNLDPGSCSYTYSFYFKDEGRTLKDEEVEQCMQRIIKQIETQMGGIIRKA